MKPKKNKDVPKKHITHAKKANCQYHCDLINFHHTTVTQNIHNTRIIEICGVSVQLVNFTG